MRLVTVLILGFLTACGPDFATRYETGNAALSSSQGAVYLVLISPILQNALNTCIPHGLKGASPVIVIVADVDAAGSAKNLDVEPDSPGTDCLAADLAGRVLPRPPLAARTATFPVGLKVETR